MDDYSTAAGRDAIADLLEFLGGRSQQQLLDLAKRRGVNWHPQASGNVEAHLRLLAQQLAYLPQVLQALQQLSRRQLSLLRMLLSHAPEISRTGMASYFAPALSREVLRQELTHLQALALMLPVGDQGAVYVPEFVRSALIGRTALARPAALLLRTMKSDALQQICLHLGLTPDSSTRGKAAAVQHYLSDETKLRAAITALSTSEREVLNFIAASGGQIDPWTLSQRLPNSVSRGSYGGFLMSPAEKVPGDKVPPSLALVLKALLLPVPGNWPTQFVIPDEVLDALQPDVQLTAEAFSEPALEAPEGTHPAGTLPTPVLDLVETLRYVEELTPSITQRGLIAKPDSRRLSRRLSTPDSNYADLLFTIAIRLGLCGLNGSVLTLEPSWREWLGDDELSQRTAMFQEWSELADWFDDAAEPYPRSIVTALPLPRREATLDLLRSFPPEGATLDSVAALLEFRRPGLFELSPLNSSGPIPQGAQPWVRGVLRTLGWLGLAEPLVRPGTPGSPAATTGMRLTAFGRAILQGDETARAAAVVPRTDRIMVQPTLEVVAPPNVEPRLYFSLRVVAEPTTAHGVRTLTLTGATLRSALDAGATKEQIRALLAEHNQAPLPNTVEQLLADVSAKHGLVRVGTAGYYLTVTEPRLLEEIQADRRVGRMVTKVLAPTVALVNAGSLEEVLQALRAAGHMPVADVGGATSPGARGLHLVGAMESKATSPTALRPRQWVSGLELVRAVCEEALATGVQAEISYLSRMSGEEIITEHRIEVLAVDPQRVSAYDRVEGRERRLRLSHILQARLTRRAASSNSYRYGRPDSY